MKKTIFIFLLFSLILTSCSDDKKQEKIGENISPKIDQIQEKTTIDEEVIFEKRKQIYLEDMPNDEKQIFEELSEAQKSKDKQKEDELLKNIKTLEETKRKELADAVKNGDNEKAKKLRKEMRIFGIIRR